MRGQSAPGRLETADRRKLRYPADEMDRSEVLDGCSIVPDTAGLVVPTGRWSPTSAPDIVSIQVMSRDPMSPPSS